MRNVSVLALAVFAAGTPAVQAQSPGGARDDAPTTDCDTYAGGISSDRHGVPYEQINPVLAIPACESAVGQHPKSSRLIFQLGRAYGKANKFGVSLAQYLKAAELGYAPAQNNLGIAYGLGLGVEKDEAQAAAWYRKAADQGDAVAQGNLGRMYASGRGVAQDYAQAAAWARKAAEQGEVEAQSSLGYMYEIGRGVLQNNAEAIKWYRLAADQGDAFAQDSLRLMYRDGRGVPLDPHEYKRTAFDDFALDGKDLAASSARVSVQGIYIRPGEIETLFPSLLSIAMARQSLGANAGIVLLTTDATRSARKLLLNCQNNPVGAQIGCPLTIRGRASMCTKTTLVGSTEVPCLIVEDAASASLH
jgi:hypothetical protein